MRTPNLYSLVQQGQLPELKSLLENRNFVPVQGNRFMGQEFLKLAWRIGSLSIRVNAMRGRGTRTMERGLLKPA